MRGSSSDAQDQSVPPLPFGEGRYRLIRRLAVGGMAEIYLAAATAPSGTERLVAVKRVLPHLSENQEFVTMFFDEARLAASLQHPNIVEVYQALISPGEHSVVMSIVMEYLHGEDVRKLLGVASQRGSPVSLSHCLAIVTSVCAGLHYAHEKVGAQGEAFGIVHRDVSPSNIFVTFDGAVKVLDFGVAKAVNRLTETRSGGMKGKVRYASPEQITGGDLDRRSDVFSLGVVLWELTTGRRLHDRDTELEIMQATISREARTPSSVRSDYPVELERIVMRALARDPEQRYPSAEALRVDLEQFARERRMALCADGLASLMKELIGERVVPSLDDELSWEKPSAPEVLQRQALALVEPETERGPGLRRPRRGVRWGLAAGIVTSVIAMLAWTARPRRVGTGAVTTTAPSPLPTLRLPAPPVLLAVPSPIVGVTPTTKPPNRLRDKRRANLRTDPLRAAKGRPVSHWDLDSPLP